MANTHLKTPPDPRGLLRAAELYGTPTYLYDERTIRRQCTRLRNTFKELPLRLLYSAKANTQPALLRIVLDEGIGLDIVSPGELKLALHLGFDPDDLLYSANNMTEKEMQAVQQAGVLLNLGGLSRLEKYGRAYPGSDVCLRVNPKIGGGHHDHVITAGKHSKFGFALENLEEARAIVREYDLTVVGLHQHIGSGILDPGLYWQAMRVLLDEAMAFPDLQFLNFGGGFGIPYYPEEEEIDLGELLDLIRTPLEDFRNQHPSEDLTFCFEPGRYLVAEAGILLVQVNTLKETPHCTFAGTSSGMSHLLRPALYDAYHAVYNLSNPDGPLKTYDITGNICESADLFAKDRSVPEIREGDILAVLDTGAYGVAMASEYNLRPLPAEVLRREDGSLEQIRPRRSAEWLVNRLLEETEGLTASAI